MIDILAGTNTYWTTNEPSTFFFGVLPLYGLFLFIGFLVGTAYAYVEWNKKGNNTWDFLFMTSFTVIFALYGAKLWYMIFSPLDTFANVDGVLDVFIIFFIPAFGRSILGTIVFTPIGLLVWQRVWGGQYKALSLMDIVMPALLLSQAIGRFGNMFDHNVYGAIVSKEQIEWLPNWIQSHMFIDGEYRQPLFLYESMVDMIGFIILVIVFKTNDYWEDGVAAFSYIALYGFIRACIEPFRDAQFKMSWGSFPTTWIASLALILVGVSLVVYLQLIKTNKLNIRINKHS